MFLLSTPEGYMWSGERLTKIEATARPDHRWLRMWSDMSKAAWRREKQEWAMDETKAR